MMSDKGTIREHFDGYAASWHGRLRSYPYRARREAVGKMLEGLQPGVVVDVGCGTGDYAPLFDPAVTRYTGIDLSDKMIQHCRSLYPGYAFAVGDADKTGLPAEYADLVLSIAVLEYYEDPVPHVRELDRICKPGGQIIIAVPNGEDVSKIRENKVLELMTPVIELKHRLWGSRNTESDSRHGREVLHIRYTEEEMAAVGKPFGMILAETSFVNFQPLPRILDQYLQVNERWSRQVISRGWSRRFRKSATILVCRFLKDAGGDGAARPGADGG